MVKIMAIVFVRWAIFDTIATHDAKQILPVFNFCRLLHAGDFPAVGAR
jgi:hypothetical protein